MKALNYFAAAALVVAAFSFTSCNKEDETTPLAEVLQQDDEVDTYFDEILAEADEEAYSDGSVKSAELDYTKSSGTRTVLTAFEGDYVIHTITFSNFANTRRPDRVKNGKIEVKVLGHYNESNFWRQVKLIDFSINDLPMQGTKVIEKTAEHQFTITLTGGRVNFADGTFYTRELTRTRDWTAGFDTPFDISDDEYALDGEAAGINRAGNAYTHTITSPLIVRMNCRWIVQGTIEFVVNNQTAVLDYGDGTCDRIATLTVNGNIYTINLRGSL